MQNSALCFWNLRLQPVHVMPACGIFHISWSWRVGLFPWHFVVCSLHFAQRWILFLPLPVGLSSSHTWDGAVAKLRCLTLCSVCQGGMGSVTLWLPGSWPRAQMMRTHFGFLVWSSAISSAQKETVSFSGSAGWFFWCRKQRKVKNWREFDVLGVLMLLQSLLVARKPGTSRPSKFLLT